MLKLAFFISAIFFIRLHLSDLLKKLISTVYELRNIKVKFIDEIVDLNNNSPFQIIAI